MKGLFILTTLICKGLKPFMDMVMAVLRQPDILRHAASNGEYPREFQEATAYQGGRNCLVNYL